LEQIEIENLKFNMYTSIPVMSYMTILTKDAQNLFIETTKILEKLYKMNVKMFRDHEMKDVALLN
jgi:hypothetical protein